MDQAKITELLNDDLSTGYQSIVQCNLHISTVTGPEFVCTMDQLTKHRSQELNHTRVLADQVSFLGGQPTTTSASPVPEATGSRGGLKADLQLEEEESARFRDRFAQANDLGLADVGEALWPLLEQTQERVQDPERPSADSSLAPSKSRWRNSP